VFYYIDKMNQVSEKNKIKCQYPIKSRKESFEAKQNLLGFFSKLLEIDMRNNPEKYKKPKEKND